LPCACTEKVASNPAIEAVCPESATHTSTRSFAAGVFVAQNNGAVRIDAVAFAVMVERVTPAPGFAIRCRLNPPNGFADAVRASTGTSPPDGVPRPIAGPPAGVAVGVLVHVGTALVVAVGVAVGGGTPSQSMSVPAPTSTCTVSP
jgi:hypothetical protein